MSPKTMKSIGSAKPVRMWIDGKCYNLKQFKSSPKKGFNKSSSSSSTNESKDKEDENKELQNLIINEISFNVDESSGKLYASFELPLLYYSKLRQYYLSDLNLIRNQTNTTVTLPPPGKTGKLVIAGNDETKLKEALNDVYSVIGQIRNREKATQFIAIPLLSDEIKNNFTSFKNDVLKEKDTTKGMDESIFISPSKLHLTIEVFVLLNDREKTEATRALEEWNDSFLKPLIEKFGPLKIQVAGIDCMNEDYQKVDVLYANAKIVSDTEDTSLQKITNSLSEHFYEKGLLKEHNENVKLHMTLINTRYRKALITSPKHRWAKRVPFDASKIMEKYKDFEFGICDLKAIHISNIGSEGQDGFYKNIATVAV